MKEHKMVSGLPGLFGNGYDGIILERMALAGNPIPEPKTAEFCSELQTLREETYEDMPAFPGKIKSLLPVRGSR